MMAMLLLNSHLCGANIKSALVSGPRISNKRVFARLEEPPRCCQMEAEPQTRSRVWLSRCF